MKTKSVEVQRKELSEKDTETLQAKMSELESLRQQYGQHQFGLDLARAQYEEVVKANSEQGDTLRSGIQAAQTTLQELSQAFLKDYDIDTSSGGWSLDTYEGAFIQYQEEEVKVKRRTKSKAVAKKRTTKGATRRSTKPKYRKSK